MKMSRRVHEDMRFITDNYRTTGRNTNGRTSKQQKIDHERLIVLQEVLEQLETEDFSDTVLMELIRRQSELIVDLMAGRILIPRKVRNGLKRRT